MKDIVRIETLPHKYTSNSLIRLKVKNDFDETSNRFKSFLNVHNYFIVTIENGLHYKLIYVERYIQDDATEDVYESYNGILYHVTTKSRAEKIIKYGLHPKGNEYEESHINLIGNGNKHTRHPKRLYFFSNKSDDNKIYNTLYNDINNDNYCLLKIDLNKYKRTIKFFKDDSFIDIRSLFTYEPIPPICISIVNNKNTLMNIDIFVSVY